MATSATKLYASQGNGGSSSVTIAELIPLVGGANAPLATTTTPGVVLESATVAALTSVGPGTPAGTIVDVGAAFSQTTLNANFATLGTSVNAMLAALKAAGLMA